MNSFQPLVAVLCIYTTYLQQKQSLFAIFGIISLSRYHLSRNIAFIINSCQVNRLFYYCTALPNIRNSFTVLPMYYIHVCNQEQTNVLRGQMHKSCSPYVNSTTTTTTYIPYYTNIILHNQNNHVITKCHLMYGGTKYFIKQLCFWSYRTSCFYCGLLVQFGGPSLEFRLKCL